MARLFYSYSHHDEALRDQLEAHLTTLRRTGELETWHDRRIDAGDLWDKRIRQELEEADIILLLVSVDFLASDYCHDIEVEGEFGLLHVHIENIPSENPKTGRLTALSMIRAIQDAVDYVRIGT